MKPPIAQLDSAYRALEQAGLLQAFETFREYIDGMEEEIAGEQERAKRLCEALRLLHDYQNGCPLPKYEKYWNEAMRLAEAALKESEPQQAIADAMKEVK